MQRGTSPNAPTRLAPLDDACVAGLAAPLADQLAAALAKLPRAARAPAPSAEAPADAGEDYLAWTLADTVCV